MSLIAVLASAVAAAAAPSPNTVTAVVPMRCEAPGMQPAERRRPRRGYKAARPLSEMPAADMHLLVDRRVNGCAVPVIVVRDVESRLTNPPAAPRPAGEPARRR